MILVQTWSHVWKIRKIHARPAHHSFEFHQYDDLEFKARHGNSVIMIVRLPTDRRLLNISWHCSLIVFRHKFETWRMLVRHFQPSIEAVSQTQGRLLTQIRSDEAASLPGSTSEPQSQNHTRCVSAHPLQHLSQDEVLHGLNPFKMWLKSLSNVCSCSESVSLFLGNKIYLQLTSIYNVSTTR